MLKLFIVLMLCVPVSAKECSSDNTAECGKLFSRQYGRAIHRLDDLAVKTDFALDAMIRVAVVNMRAKGELYWADADRIEFLWQSQYKGYLTSHYRDIGDHSPLSLYLAETYEIIELALGVDVCKALHLSDIKTLNFCIPVVFRPCTFPMDGITLVTRRQEYQYHFARGMVYTGLVPVIGYWAMTIGCWTGTSGAGAFLCTIAATAGEWGLANVVCPPLSDWMFSAICGG